MEKAGSGRLSPHLAAEHVVFQWLVTQKIPANLLEKVIPPTFNFNFHPVGVDALHANLEHQLAAELHAGLRPRRK